MDKLKKILNNPKTLIIVLTILLGISVLTIYKLSNSSKIYISSVKDENVSISTIHAFINKDMNMFYSTPATYNKTDEKIYAIETGYYIKENDTYNEFLIQKDEFDKAESLKQVLEFYSSYNYIERNNNVKIFTESTKKNFNDNLYFIIKIKKEKDGRLDKIYEKNIEMKKITK